MIVLKVRELIIPVGIAIAVLQFIVAMWAYISYKLHSYEDAVNKASDLEAKGDRTATTLATSHLHSMTIYDPILSRVSNIGEGDSFRVVENN